MDLSNFNFNSDKINIYTPELHQCIAEGVCSNNKEFVYIINFRVLNREKKEVVYYSVSYPKLFLKSLICFLIQKKAFTNSVSFKEFGDYFIIFDNNLLSERRDNKIFNNQLSRNKHWSHYYESSLFVKPSDYITLFDFIKKTTRAVNSEDLVNSIIFGINKDFVKFFTVLFKEDLNNIKPSDTNDMYIIKDCYYVVNDIKKVLNLLALKGYNVNKGPKNCRNQLSSISLQMALIDLDYRNFLYDIQMNVVKTSYYANERSKYSFTNIHRNIGNIRLYSTLSRKSNFNGLGVSQALSHPNTKKGYSNIAVLPSNITSRDRLYEYNYKLIKDILDKHYHMGNEKVQEEIENVLLNQETVFEESNRANMELNYGKQTFDLLETKQKLILKGLDNFNIKKEGRSEYTPIWNNILNLLDKKDIANMLLGYFMHILTKESETKRIEEVYDVETKGMPSVTAFSDFGQTLFRKLLYKEYKMSNSYMKNISLSEFTEREKKEYKIVYENIQINESYATIGSDFVWILVEVGLLYKDYGINPEDNKTIEYLRIPLKIREIIIKNSIRLYHLPQKLPMVCPPKNYVYSSDKLEENKLGGYLLNDIAYTDKLIKHKKGTKEETTLSANNIIIKMVNNYMKTPYKINVDVLKYIYTFGIEKGMLIDDSQAKLKEFISNPYKKYSKNGDNFRAIVSKIVMERNIINIAETYSKIEKIYFPLSLDYRTRIYASTDYFDFQKTDLAKGLISFANPGVIKKSDLEAIMYFKAYGANMFGQKMDKKSLSYRVKWIDKNSERILNFENNNIIDIAENKTCFVAFCYEYVRFMKFMSNNDEVIFNTYLPVQLDATCNGYQHLALLTKENKLLTKLNLNKSTIDDDPNDFYQYLNDLIYDHIEAKIEILKKGFTLNLKVINSLYRLNKLFKIKLGRSLIKIAIMRESYSAGVPTLVKNVLAHESIIEVNSGEYSYNGSEIFGRYELVTYIMCLKEVISNIAPKIKQLTKYLDGVVKICSKLNVPVPWLLPHGAYVLQSYMVEEKERFPSFSFTRSRYTFIKYLPGEFDYKKQKRAIRPNLIHSLDATTIALLYDSLEGKVDLYTIHDCFAVTANNVPLLINKLKLVYIKLYSSNDYLVSFDDFIRLTLKNTLGEDIFCEDGKFVNIPSQKGIKKIEFPDVTKITQNNLNIEDILKSSYPII